MNKLFTLGIICIIGTIFYGFSSLHYKVDILMDPRALCCNDARCNERLCSEPSSAYLKPYCNFEVSITCYDCIYLSARGQVCYNPSYTCCILHDGVTRYCGGPNPLKEGKN